MEKTHHPAPLRQQLSPRIQTILDGHLKNILPQYFGFHLLQIGYPRYTTWLNHSPIHHQIILTDIYHPPSPGKNFIEGNPTQLPFQNDSIDVIILPCVLEQIEYPDSLLAEAWRVLIPNGKLIIFDFNLLSVWRLLHPRSKLSAYKIKKWLWSLGCIIDQIDYFSYCPNNLNKYLLQKRTLWEHMAKFFLTPLSELYQITATKQIVRLTPIKPTWQAVLDDKP